jgi:hypothetical protein
VTKILVKKIVSLYPIFFSKIVYLYRFKRYIFEYRCPTLGLRDQALPSENDSLYQEHRGGGYYTQILQNCFICRHKMTIVD